MPLRKEQNKYSDIINLMKNITGLGLIIFIVVANVMYDKEIDMLLLAIPGILMGVDISKLIKK